MTAPIPNDLFGWFASDGLALVIFYGIGIVAGVVLLLQTGLLLLGHDGGDHDLDAGDGATGFFSLRSLVAFFVGFGWTGVIALKAGLGVPAAIALSVLVGGLFMAAIFGIVRGLYSQRSSGNVDPSNAIGQVGRVYVGIPPASGAGGQIQITFQGRHQTLPALTLGAESLPSGTPVVVRALIPPDTLVVEKA